MNKLLASCLALVSFALPAFAGLGDADSETIREFDAWCGKRNNKCKVSFAESRMTVNGKDSITRDQLRRFGCDQQYNPWTDWGPTFTCNVIYNEDGAEKSGTFIFVNDKAFADFRRALDVFCGSTCREVGPSFKVDK